jgi:hypothetical protein
MSDERVVYHVMHNKGHPERPIPEECPGDCIPDALWLLALQCWHPIPEQRPHMSEIIPHLERESGSLHSAGYRASIASRFSIETRPDMKFLGTHSSST